MMKKTTLFILLTMSLLANETTINTKKLIESIRESTQKELVESPEVIDKIIVSRGNFGKNRVGVEVHIRLQSNSCPYTYGRLSIYEKDKNKIVTLLSNFKVLKRDGEKGYCDFYEREHKYLLEKKSTPSKLIFKHTYRFSHEEFCKENKTEEWKVTLKPTVLSLNKRKYQIVSSNKKAVFDLNEIVKNTKKGWRYRTIVLKAMLFEEPIAKENVELYAKIGSNLKNAKHTKEALFLLDKIFRSKIKTALGYVTLADIYYEKGVKQQKLADKLFKEGEVNPSSISMQSNANMIKALMLYREYSRLLEKEGIHSLGKVIDARLEELEHFVMESDNLIEFLKTGIYADIMVYDYLDNKLQENEDIMSARDVNLKDGGI